MRAHEAVFKVSFVWIFAKFIASRARAAQPSGNNNKILPKPRARARLIIIWRHTLCNVLPKLYVFLLNPCSLERSEWDKIIIEKKKYLSNNKIKKNLSVYLFIFFFVCSCLVSVRASARGKRPCENFAPRARGQAIFNREEERRKKKK